VGAREGTGSSQKNLCFQRDGHRGTVFGLFESRVFGREKGLGALFFLTILRGWGTQYGVATISRLLKSKGL